MSFISRLHHLDSRKLDSPKLDRPKRIRTRTITKPPGSTFVAVDFETANRWRDSACAVSVISVVEGEITDVFSTLIRPPSSLFEFTHIHGITYEQVRHSPTFQDIAPELTALLRGAPFIAAHNASFDSSVVATLCTANDIPVPVTPWLCTVRLARRTWKFPRCGLADVSRHLDIPLNHHDAESDARACALIVVAALQAQQGSELSTTKEAGGR